MELHLFLIFILIIALIFILTRDPVPRIFARLRGYNADRVFVHGFSTQVKDKLSWLLGAGTTTPEYPRTDIYVSRDVPLGAFIADAKTNDVLYIDNAYNGKIEGFRQVHSNYIRE